MVCEGKEIHEMSEGEIDDALRFHSSGLLDAARMYEDLAHWTVTKGEDLQDTGRVMRIKKFWSDLIHEFTQLRSLETELRERPQGNQPDVK